MTSLLPCNLRGLLAALPLLALTLTDRGAAAHEKWLEVEPFSVAAPTTTKLYLVTGDALRAPEQLPIRARSRLTRFELLTRSGPQALLGSLREDAQPIAVLPAGTLPPGTSVLRIDTAPIDILLTAEKFQTYLFEERLIDILMQRAERNEEELPGRERYSRSIKALVQVGPKLDELATRPLGQELEIVPLRNPYGAAVGSTLTVQVLFRGQPLARRAVLFANRYHSNVVTKLVRTDVRGQVACPIERAGEWLVSLVHMERSRESGADWRSHWSSLTFELPEAATNP